MYLYMICDGLKQVNPTVLPKMFFFQIDRKCPIIKLPMKKYDIILCLKKCIVG
jgi:hypothetical protein